MKTNLQNLKVYDLVNLDLNKAFIFDFTESNEELKRINLENTEEFTNYIFRKMEENNTSVGIGKYNENRTIYARSSLFNEDPPRTVHLGIDIWAQSRTKVFAPLEGKVHSFQNNNTFGDYGPTKILEHKIGESRFYTLYGHLSLDSIENLKVEQEMNAGEEIARIGNFPINGNWPPHLHFQIITDMQGKFGDFPGVASIKDRKKFLDLCPDPDLILGIKKNQSLVGSL